MYRNEAAVGEAVRESGINRSALFISETPMKIWVYFWLWYSAFSATKCASRSHGYESTLSGVDESLSKLQFGIVLIFRMILLQYLMERFRLRRSFPHSWPSIRIRETSRNLQGPAGMQNSRKNQDRRSLKLVCASFIFVGLITNQDITHLQQ